MSHKLGHGGLVGACFGCSTPDKLEPCRVQIVGQDLVYVCEHCKLQIRVAANILRAPDAAAMKETGKLEAMYELGLVTKKGYAAAHRSEAARRELEVCRTEADRLACENRIAAADAEVERQEAEKAAEIDRKSVPVASPMHAGIDPDELERRITARFEKQIAAMKRELAAAKPDVHDH